jgi:hypothetical protein
MLFLFHRVTSDVYDSFQRARPDPERVVPRNSAGQRETASRRRPIPTGAGQALMAEQAALRTILLTLLFKRYDTCYGERGDPHLGSGSGQQLC